MRSNYAAACSTVLSAVVMLAFPIDLPASIISTAGAVVVTEPPSDIQNGAWESNTDIRAFAELQNVTLTDGVAVQITAPGTSPSDVSQNLSPGTIMAGTTVNSYFLHFDAVGAPTDQNAVSASGSITFSSNILGIAMFPSTLNPTDPIFGLPGVTYATGQGPRGLDIAPGQFGTMSNDEITLTADLRTVTVNLSDAASPDEFRVFTATPEPSSACLEVAGAVGLWAFFRARRRATSTEPSRFKA
jgi:hypothetical protein